MTITHPMIAFSRVAASVLTAGALLLAGITPAAAASAPEDLSISLVLVSDGTAPFDSDSNAGNDASANNGIVRVNDTVDYRVEYTVQNNAATNTTFSITFPKGMALKEVPAFCTKGGSLNPTYESYGTPLASITASTYANLTEQTLTCNVGDVPASATREATITAQVLSPVPQATKLTIGSVGIKADGVDNYVTAPTATLPSVTTSSRLKWDLSKNGVVTTPNTGYIYGPIYSPCPWDRARACFQTTYPILLSAPDGGKGAMPAVGDITLTDDLSPRALYPELTDDQIAQINANLDKYGSRVYEAANRYMIPNRAIGHQGGTATNSVRDSGTMQLVQAGPGQAVDITFKNPDLSLLTYPTRVATPANTAIPTANAYAIARTIDVFTPADTIKDFGTKTAGIDEWKLVTRNTFTNLRINGLTSADVQTSADQSADNDYRTTEPRIQVQSHFSKAFAGVPGAANNTMPAAYYPAYSWLGTGMPGGATRLSGRASVAPNQEVITTLYTTGTNPLLPGKVSQVVCDAWDNSKLYLKAKDWPSSSANGASNANGGQLVPSAGKAVWVSGYRNIPNAAGTDATDATDPSQTPPITVQYSPVPATNGSQVNCLDSVGTWYDDPALVPGNDPDKMAEGIYTGVGRVRIHIVIPEPVGPFVAIGNGIPVLLSIGMQVAETTDPTGTVIPNWASTRRVNLADLTMEEILARPGAWPVSSYQPKTNPEAPTGSPGDRLIYTDIQVRVNKTVRKGDTGTFSKTPPATTGGDLVQYKLDVSAINPAGIGGVKRDVWVEDCLPTSQNFETAQPEPTVVSDTVPSDAKRTCPAGTRYIRWEYPDHEAGQPIDPIIMNVRVSGVAANGVHDNTVVVWGENEASLLSERTANAQIQISNLSGLNLDKRALTPVVEVNREGQIANEVNWWRVALKNTRAAGSAPVTNPTVIDVFPKNGEGGSSFAGTMTFVEAKKYPDTAPDLTFHYTKSTSVNIDPQHESNTATGSTPWCDAPGGGTLVTGTGDCPASAAEVTAIRVIKNGTFASSETFEFDVALVAQGNADGDAYVNRVAASAAGFTSTVGPIGRTETAVASSIGDRLWIDANGNGVQDEGEAGVPGATVTIKGTDDLGNPVLATTQTAADGTYAFTQLRASDASGYTVTFTIPPSYVAQQYEFTTTTVAGNDGTSDSNPNGIGVSEPIVLGKHADNLTVDAGVVRPEIDLVKDADKTENVKPGDVITYTFTATNTGSAILRNVNLADTSFTNAHGNAIDIADLTFRGDLSTGSAIDEGGVTNLTMAPNQTLVWSGTYTVQREDLTVDGTLDNTAEVTGISPRDTVVTDTAERRVNSGATEAYTYAKTAEPTSPVAVGDVITYTLTVTNSGDLPLTGAAVSDDLSGVLDDATFDDSSLVADIGTVTFNGSTLNWRGDLEYGQSATITYSVKVMRGGDLSLRNSVGRTDPSDARGSCATSTACQTTHTIPAAPKITLVKTASPTSVSAGDVITYTFKATNTGNVPLTDVTLNEDSFTNARGEAITLDADPVVVAEDSTGTPASMGVDQVIVWTGTYTVTASDLDAGKSIANTATVTGTPPAGDPVTSSSSATVDSAGRGGFTMEKTAVPPSGNVATGDTVTYQVTIRHAGELRTLGATVSDDLSGVLDDATWNGDLQVTGAPAASASYDADSKTLTWSGDLEVGAVVTLTYSVTVDKAGDLSLVNAVTTTDDRGSCELNASCETTHAVQPAPSIDLVKTALVNGAPGGAASAGDVITYRFTATNTGNVPLTDVELSEESFTNARGETITLDSAPVVVTADSTGTPASMGVGQVIVWEAAYTVKVTDLEEGQAIANVAKVTGASPSGDPVEDSDEELVDSFGFGSFVFSKVAEPASDSQVAEGETITYTVKVKQEGELRVLGATVSDDLSDVLDDATYNNDATATLDGQPAGVLTFSGSTLTWTGDIEVGAEVVITYSVTTKKGGDLQLVNSVSTEDDRGSCAAGEYCDTVHSIPAAPAIELVKEASPSSVEAGDVITYTFTATNTGNVPLSGVTLGEDSFTNARGEAISLDAPPVVDATASTASVDDMGVGEVIVWKAQYTVQASDLDEDQFISNAATVTGIAPSGDEVSDDSSAQVVSEGKGTFAFTKTASSNGQVAVGDTISYEILVKPTGTLRVVGATLSDDLSAVLDDATWNGDLSASKGVATFEGGKVRWTGTVDPGDEIRITYSVTVALGGDLDITNVVSSADPRGGCEGEGRCTTTNTIPPAPSIELVKSANMAEVAAGDVITYTFTATNTGNVPLSGVTLSEDSFTNARGEAISLDSAPVVLDAASTGSVDTLGVGQRVVWTASYTVKAADLDEGASILNGASVTATAPVDSEVRDEDDAAVASAGTGAFRIAKSSDPASGSVLEAGATVVYTVRITHAEQLRVVGATVVDDLSGVLDDATWNGDLTVSSGTASLSGSTLTWSGDVDPGAVITMTYSVTVKAGGDRALTNVAKTAHPKGSCVAESACTTEHTVALPDPVTPADPGKSGSSLAKSGTDAWVVGAIAVLVLAAGVILLVIRRRRDDS